MRGITTGIIGCKSVVVPDIDVIVRAPIVAGVAVG